MANLKFDTGLVILNVQGDPLRKFKFNPTDHKVLSGFLDLIDDATNRIKEFAAKSESISIEKLGEEEYSRQVSNLMAEIDKWFRKEFDKVFGKGQARLVFENVSTSALNNDGEYIMIAMLMALYPHFERAIENRAKTLDEVYGEIMKEVPTEEKEPEEAKAKVVGFKAGDKQGE